MKKALNADLEGRPLPPPKRSGLVKVRFNQTAFSLHRIKGSDSEEPELFSGSSLEAHHSNENQWTETKGDPPPAPPGLKRPELWAVTPESAAAPLAAATAASSRYSCKNSMCFIRGNRLLGALNGFQEKPAWHFDDFFFFLRGNACIVHTHCVYQALCFNNFISAGRSNNTRERCGGAFTGNKLTSHSPTSVCRSAFLKQIPIRGRGKRFQGPLLVPVEPDTTDPSPYTFTSAAAASATNQHVSRHTRVVQASHPQDSGFLRILRILWVVHPAAQTLKGEETRICCRATFLSVPVPTNLAKFTKLHHKHTTFTLVKCVVGL